MNEDGRAIVAETKFELVLETPRESSGEAVLQDQED
jgi:hypothetical protein